MSALALPSFITSAKVGAPQGSAGSADATGFKSLLTTCLDKDAASVETEEPVATPANDDAKAAATTIVLAPPVPVPVPVAAPPAVLKAGAPASPPPPGEAAPEIEPSTPPLISSAPPPVAASPVTQAKPETAPPVRSEAPVSGEPIPAATGETTGKAETVGATETAKAVAAAQTVEAKTAETKATPAAGAVPRTAPEPAPPPLRALAERTSRPLDRPLDKAADASASPPAATAAGAVTVSASAASSSQSVPDRQAGPGETAPGAGAEVASNSDEPSIDAAPAAPENGANSSATAAQVRETSLSGLSRATIDATAQIAAQILRKLEGRSTRFEMALTPDDLGRVDIKLDIDSEGRLAARLAFDNPAAATDLRGRVDDLRRELEDAGFHMADDAFEFAERDSGSSGFDRGQDAREGQNRAFAAASRLNAEIDVAQPPRWMALTLSPAGVDLKV